MYPCMLRAVGVVQSYHVVCIIPIDHKLHGSSSQVVQCALLDVTDKSIKCEIQAQLFKSQQQLHIELWP